MKKILSLAVAALVCSAGMMHAVNVGKQVMNVGVTREIPPVELATEPATSSLVKDADPVWTPATLTAAQLASLINAADLSTDAGRAAMKQQVVAAFTALNFTQLTVVSAWCDALVGNGTTTGVTTPAGKQLIADIVVMQPVLKKAIAFINAGVPADMPDYEDNYKAFILALNNLKNCNNTFPGEVEAAVNARSLLDDAFRDMLGALLAVFGHVNIAFPAVPKSSSWDALGKLLILN